MSQRNRDLVLLSWPAASFVTVRTVLPCLVNVWFMWKWTPQGDRPVIPKNAMLPATLSSRGSLFIHPAFFFSSNKMMGVFIECTYLFLTSSVCLSRNKDKCTRKASNFIWMLSHIFQWEKWPMMEDIAKLWNNTLPGKFREWIAKISGEWLALPTDECRKNYAAICLLFWIKHELGVRYHWRMTYCLSGLFLNIVLSGTICCISYMSLDLLCILFRPGSGAAEVRIHLLQASRRKPLQFLEDQHTGLM